MLTWLHMKIIPWKFCILINSWIFKAKIILPIKIIFQPVRYVLCIGSMFVMNYLLHQINMQSIFIQYHFILCYKVSISLLQIRIFLLTGYFLWLSSEEYGDQGLLGTFPIMVSLGVPASPFNLRYLQVPPWV